MSSTSSSSSSSCCCCCGRRPLSPDEADRAELLSPRSRKALEDQLGSAWFRVGSCTTRTRWSVAVVVGVLAVTVPVSLQVMHMRTTIDSTMLFPSGSPALHTYRQMQKHFPAGFLFPFQVLAETGRPGGVLTEAYFDSSQAAVGRLVAEGDVHAANVTGVTYLGGLEPTLEGVTQCLLSPECPEWPWLAPFRPVYQLVFSRQTSPSNASTLITLNTDFDPLNEESEGWVRRVRRRLADATAESGGAAVYRLTGGSTAPLDTVDDIFRRLPLIAGVTTAMVAVVVGLQFRSVSVPVRLILTTTLPITWVYGVAVLVFERGLLDSVFPTLSHSKYIYWLVPVMSLPVLLGLALDYDIFLVSRAHEYRMAGFTDRACIVKSVYRTGPTITAAGMIMAVSFAGLLLSEETVLVQFGFVLCLAVLFDTFVVRVALVPAVLHLGGSTNWWPGRVPLGVYDELDVFEPKDDVLAGTGPPTPGSDRGDDLLHAPVNESRGR